MLFGSLYGFAWCARDAGKAHWWTVATLQVTWALVLALIAVDFAVVSFGHHFVFKGDGLARLLLLLAWYDGRDALRALDDWYLPLVVAEEATARSKLRMMHVVPTSPSSTTDRARAGFVSHRLPGLDLLVKGARRRVPSKPALPLTRPTVLVVYFVVLALALWESQEDEKREAGWLSLASVWMAAPTVLYRIVATDARRSAAVRHTVGKLPPTVKQLHAPRAAAQERAAGGPCPHCAEQFLAVDECTRCLLWVAWFCVAVALAGVSLKYAPLGYHALLLLWSFVPKCGPYFVHTFRSLARVKAVRLDVTDSVTVSRTGDATGPEPATPQRSATPDAAARGARAAAASQARFRQGNPVGHVNPLMRLSRRGAAAAASMRGDAIRGAGGGGAGAAVESTTAPSTMRRRPGPNPPSRSKHRALPPEPPPRTRSRTIDSGSQLPPSPPSRSSSITWR